MIFSSANLFAVLLKSLISMKYEKTLYGVNSEVLKLLAKYNIVVCNLIFQIMNDSNLNSILVVTVIDNQYRCLT